MCNSLNNTPAALNCVSKYTSVYDGIVTVLKRDHPQLNFVGLVLAFPDCPDAEVTCNCYANSNKYAAKILILRNTIWYCTATGMVQILS